MSSSIAPLLARLARREAELLEPALALRGFGFLAPDDVALDLGLEGSDSPTEFFRVVGHGVVDLRIVSSCAEPLHLLTEYSQLRQFSEPWAELTFVGKPYSLLQLLGALWTAHDAWCGQTLPFGTFLNAPDRLAWLLAGGHGLLARGPRSFIDGLRKVLTRFEIGTSVLPIPGDVDRASDVSLLRFGGNFIVARTFNVEPIHSSRALAASAIAEAD